MEDPETKLWTAEALNAELASLKKTELFDFAKRHGLMSSATAPSINFNDFKFVIVGAALKESRVHPEAAPNTTAASIEDVQIIKKSIDDVGLRMDRLVRELQSNLEDALKRAVAAIESAKFVSAQYDDIALQKTVSG